MNDLKKETNTKFNSNLVLVFIVLALVALLVWFVVIPKLNPPVPKIPVVTEETIPPPPPPPPAPKVIKRVDPVYPQAAITAKIEGRVEVEVTVGIDGLVKDVKVLKSDSSYLDQAAIDAVKQWVYEPFIKDGKPVEFINTIIVGFLLNEANLTTGPIGGVVGGVVPVRAIGDIKPPKRVKEVAPIYPEDARQARVEGVVILECTTDTYGRVMGVKVLRSIPVLDQAAIDAVRQWKYEPMIINGEAHAVVFTVTVRFQLK
jgi:protein TonB